MIHGAMGAGHGRCAVANRMESAPTHWVRLSGARSVSGGGLRKEFMGCHQFYTIPTASTVARRSHTAYDSPQCHSGYKPDTNNGEVSFPTRAQHRRLRRPRRRSRGAGLRHGQVFALGAVHARVAGGNQRPESRKVPQHLLLPVRPSQHRRSGAHRLCHRAPVDSGRDRRRRRAALGRPGALDPLSGLPEERLLRSRFWR